MALPDLEDHLASHGVDPALSSHLVSNGWTSQNFAMIVESKAAFTDEIWSELSDAPIPLVQRANLKVAWQLLQSEAVPSLRDSPGSAAAPPTGIQPDGSWAESFAPKIQPSTVAKLKKQFLEDYPSEVLTMETMPSTRLLSLAHHQHSKQEYRWIPWKFRMTQSRMEDMVIYQRPKIPKVEGLQLHQLLWDEPPSLEVNNQGMGVNAIRNMLEVHNTAMSLVGACHLQRLRSYTLKFMGFLTQRLDADSGLRPPNVLEAQAADKALWQMIHDLVLDQQFTLDNAIHEVTHLRSDHYFNQGLSCRPNRNTLLHQPHPLDLQKDGENRKARANKEAKRAKHLLAQPGSRRLQFKESGISYVCSSNRESVRKEIPADLAICVPTHWHRGRHAANLIARLTISSNHTDSDRKTN